MTLQTIWTTAGRSPRCYVHRLELDPYGILAESTVTRHCCVHRFQGQDRLRLTFPEGKVWREGELFFAQLPLQGTLRPVTQFLCVSVEGPYQVVSQGEGEVTLAVGERVTRGRRSLPDLPRSGPGRACWKRPPGKASTPSGNRPGRSGTSSWEKSWSPGTPGRRRGCSTPGCTGPSSG